MTWVSATTLRAVLRWLLFVLATVVPLPLFPLILGLGWYVLIWDKPVEVPLGVLLTALSFTVRIVLTFWLSAEPIGFWMI